MLAACAPKEPPKPELPSGIAVYRVQAGKIDDGTFVPLGLDVKK
jgi:hypothetical protein